MSEDARCCDTGTCIIDPEGRCWCGQQWDGKKMAHVPQQAEAAGDVAGVEPQGMPVPSS